MEIHHLRQIHDPWSKAVADLEKCQLLWAHIPLADEVRKENSQLIQDIFDVMESLPWFGAVCGFKNLEPFHSLAVYTMYGK